MISSELKNKRLLMIHNGGQKQRELYTHICEKLGIILSQISDKPNEHAFGKIAGRLHFGFYEKVLDKYYFKAVGSSDNQYDFILVIRGEYTPINAIKYLRQKNPHAKLILYMWDSVQNNRGIENKWRLFDKVYTFDRKDYLNYNKQIGFIPLFYCEEYIKKLDTSVPLKYDIAFIGTAHGDRPKIVNKIEHECQMKGLSMFKFLYCPHILVYYYNKIFNRDYKYVKKKDLSFKQMTQEEIYSIYNQTKAILDVEIKTQTGLTMRTMDILGLQKKLITTNNDIIHYDFYDSNNIMVVNRSDARLDMAFLNYPYKKLNETIYNKYSMENWLRQLLS